MKKNFLLGRKNFSIDDQQEFARISGDYNPVHVSQEVARKLFDGKPVVHGMHVLLWALELWVSSGARGLLSLRGDFKNPVFIGDEVELYLDETGDARRVLRVFVNGLLCVKLNVHLAGKNYPVTTVFQNRDTVTAIPVVIGQLSEPINKPVGEQSGNTYCVDLAGHRGHELFPSLCHEMGGDKVAALCALSFFVGMICPGLNSIFATLDIDFNEASREPLLYYSVDSFDERFNLFYVSVSGAIRGSLTAFRRPEPVAQIAVKDMSSTVSDKEFSSSNSLIIGGSRGLGEFTAKALVAGGGKVVITYVAGLADAGRLRDELNAFRPGSCEIRNHDVLGKPVSTLSDINIDVLTAVYYFATPRIFRKKSPGFNKKLFDEFFAIYVDAFYRLAEFFEARRNSPIVFFMPSSIAVTDTPDDLMEYAAAKICSEQLADAINASYKNVSVMVSRLPRLETDQTTTVVMAKADSTIDVMLPAIRAVQGSTRK